MEPLLMKPAGKDYLWGGTRLKQEFNKTWPGAILAETWECSVHPAGPSTITNGRFKGMTLDTVLKSHPEYLGTRTGMELPILIKLIDADKDLSIQVHPDDEYARKKEGQNGKTEMWYILDAKPEAKLIHGFSHSITKTQIKEAVETGTLSKHLQRVPAHKGDVFFIPPGTIHAIGSGILLVEIQESSDVTYRVYDYDRVDKNGEKRELHFDKAMEVLNMRAGEKTRQAPKTVHYYPGCSREILCRCRYFEAERIQVSMGFSFTVTEGSYQVLLCVEGSGGLETPSNRRPLRFTKGDCLFIPANTGRCHVLGSTTLLKVRN